MTALTNNSKITGDAKKTNFWSRAACLAVAWILLEDKAWAHGGEGVILFIAMLILLGCQFILTYIAVYLFNRKDRRSVRFNLCVALTTSFLTPFCVFLELYSHHSADEIFSSANLLFMVSLCLTQIGCILFVTWSGWNFRVVGIFPYLLGCFIVIGAIYPVIAGVWTTSNRQIAWMQFNGTQDEETKEKYAWDYMRLTPRNSDRRMSESYKYLKTRYITKIQQDGNVHAVEQLDDLQIFSNFDTEVIDYFITTVESVGPPNLKAEVARRLGHPQIPAKQKILGVLSGAYLKENNLELKDALLESILSISYETGPEHLFSDTMSRILNDAMQHAETRDNAGRLKKLIDRKREGAPHKDKSG